MDDRGINIVKKCKSKKAEIEWIDEETAIINGIELDVMKDKYDWRPQ